jgi:hypothetical protein
MILPHSGSRDGSRTGSLHHHHAPRSSRVALGEDADESSDDGRETSEDEMGQQGETSEGAVEEDEMLAARIRRTPDGEKSRGTGGLLPSGDEEGESMDENGLRRIPLHRLSVSTVDDPPSASVSRPHAFKIPTLVLPSVTPTALSHSISGSGSANLGHDSAHIGMSHSYSGSGASNLGVSSNLTTPGGGALSGLPHGRARFLDLKLVCPSPDRAHAAAPVSKEDKLLYFSRLCSVLTPYLCVGSRLIAQDWRQFVRHGQSSPSNSRE